MHGGTGKISGAGACQQTAELGTYISGQIAGLINRKSEVQFFPCRPIERALTVPFIGHLVGESKETQGDLPDLWAASDELALPFLLEYLPE